jgi:hypothetical protein
LHHVGKISLGTLDIRTSEDGLGPAIDGSEWGYKPFPADVPISSNIMKFEEINLQ